MGRYTAVRWIAVLIGFGLLLVPKAWAGPDVFSLGRLTFQVADVIGLGLIAVWNLLYLAYLLHVLKNPLRSGQPKN